MCSHLSVRHGAIETNAVIIIRRRPLVGKSASTYLKWQNRESIVGASVKILMKTSNPTLVLSLNRRGQVLRMVSIWVLLNPVTSAFGSSWTEVTTGDLPNSHPISLAARAISRPFDVVSIAVAAMVPSLPVPGLRGIRSVRESRHGSGNVWNEHIIIRTSENLFNNFSVIDTRSASSSTITKVIMARKKNRKMQEKKTKYERERERARMLARMLARTHSRTHTGKKQLCS